MENLFEFIKKYFDTYDMIGIHFPIFEFMLKKFNNYDFILS